MDWLIKFRKDRSTDAVAFFEYDAVNLVLTVTLKDGTVRRHLKVRQGYAVGLMVAADKGQYYAAEIVERFSNSEPTSPGG